MSTDVTIVAGGPSVNNHDISALRGDIIAINYAAIVLPQATVCYFANRDWFERFEHELRVHRGRKIHGWDGTAAQLVSKPWVESWKFVDGVLATAVKKTLCPGGHSGYAALNLAVQLGYKHVTLLGYDFLQGDVLGNFHNTHTWTDHRPAQWRRSFEVLLPVVKNAGVTVHVPRPTPSPT